MTNHCKLINNDALNAFVISKHFDCYKKVSNDELCFANK